MPAVVRAEMSTCPPLVVMKRAVPPLLAAVEKQGGVVGDRGTAGRAAVDELTLLLLVMAALPALLLSKKVT